MSRFRPHHVDPSPRSARVAFVYKTFGDTRLSHVGLGVVAANTAKVLTRNGFWSEVWGVRSGDELLERLRHTDRQAVERRHFEPTHVIINAPFVATAELATMANEFPNVTFVVVSHSNWGFLAADPHAVRTLREAVDLQHAMHNVRVAGNSEKFASSAAEVWGVDVASLPNLYDMSEPMPRPREPWPGDCLRLGLFGASRILKNGVTAAAAAVLLATRLRVPTELHVSERDESGAIAELTEGVPNLRLVHTGWLPWPRFRRVTSHMHLVLQPSFTESFNVVAADGVHAGVPCVASTAIDWVPPHWRANPDDARDVARVAESVLRDPRAVEDGRAALGAYVDAGVRTWRRFLAPPRAHEPSVTA